MTTSLPAPAEVDAPDAPVTLTRRQILTVLGGLMTGMFLAALDSTIVNVALPTIVESLGGLEHYAWVNTAYLLASTAATPVIGKLSDQYGRRLMFQVAIAAFMAGSVVAALAPSMLVLVAARLVQGIGGGGLMALAFVVLGDIVPPRERGRYVGAFTAVFAIASVAGPLLGGFFVDTLSWQWIFWVNLPLGTLALVVVSRALRLPFTRTPHRVDLAGAGLLVGAVVALVLMTTWGGREQPWASPTIIGLGLAATILGIAFVWWQTRASEPILPPHLFASRTVTLTFVCGALIGSMVFGANTFLPLFLQAVTGVSATVSGLLVLPMVTGVLISSVTAGRVVAATGRYKGFIVGGTLMVTIGAAVLTTIEPDQSRLVVGAGMLCVGLGIGMCMPNFTLAVQNAVDPADLGVGTSGITFFRSLGGAVGLAVFGSVFAARLGDELATRLPPGAVVDDRVIEDAERLRTLPPDVRDAVLEAMSRSIAAVFMVAVPVLLIAFVVALFLPELTLRDTSGLEARHATSE